MQLIFILLSPRLRLLLHIITIQKVKYYITILLKQCLNGILLFKHNNVKNITQFSIFTIAFVQQVSATRPGPDCTLKYFYLTHQSCSTQELSDFVLWPLNINLEVQKKLASKSQTRLPPGDSKYNKDTPLYMGALMKLLIQRCNAK